MPGVSMPQRTSRSTMNRSERSTSTSSATWAVAVAALAGDATRSCPAVCSPPVSMTARNGLPCHQCRVDCRRQCQRIMQIGPAAPLHEAWVARHLRCAMISQDPDLDNPGEPRYTGATYRPVGKYFRKGTLYEHHGQSQTQSHPHGVVYRRPDGRAGHRHRRPGPAGASKRASA